MNEIVLESAELVVKVRPAEGGRIASLQSRFSGLEFLTQAQRPFHPIPHSLDRKFQDGPCAGIEECLPSVGPCAAATGHAAVPDHGDLWQLEWQVSEVRSNSSLSMSANCFSRTLAVQKTLLLQSNALRVQYRLQNTGESTTDFLYACHPLFAADPGDRILLPPEVQSLRLDYSHRSRLGEPGETIPWPRPSATSPLDLSHASAANANTAEMFYTARLEQGACGLYRTEAAQGLSVSFDTARLPYLGLWFCYGGWPDLPGYPPQQALALEPTTSPFNTLTEARQHQAAIQLQPAQIFSWEIVFRISKPSLSEAEVTAWALSSQPPSG